MSIVLRYCLFCGEKTDVARLKVNEWCWKCGVEWVHGEISATRRVHWEIGWEWILIPEGCLVVRVEE